MYRLEIMQGPFLVTSDSNINIKGHSMIFCNCQVRGAAGDEGFYPVEMGEKVEQEVSPDHSFNNMYF